MAGCSDSPTSSSHEDDSRHADDSTLGADGSHQEEGTGGPRKRRRIPVACSWCRARKSRCDGQRPKCSSCESQDIECVYAQNPPAANATVPKVYLDLVEARLSAVERDVRSLKSQAPAGMLPSPESMQQPNDLPVRSVRQDPHSHDYTQVSLAPEDDGGTQAATPDSTDGVGTIDYDTEQDSAYFGPSSNIAFTRTLRRSVATIIRDMGQIDANAPVSDDRSKQAPELAVTRNPSPNSKTPSMKITPLATAGPEIDVYRIPPEAETNRLMRRFFSDTGLLYPFIHEESFMQTYRENKAQRFRKVKQTWLGLLNMILSMATSTVNTAGVDSRQRNAKADLFLARCKALCMETFMAGGSLETLQVMLLNIQYLQGTQRSIRTWMLHGVAVKAAMQLGLHSQDSLKRFNPLERETRIRVWYNLVVLDKTLSLTFGRPLAIPEHYIRVPPPSHYLASPNSAPLVWCREENSTHFFNATVSMFKIMGKVMDKLYDSNLGTGTQAISPDLADSIIQIEQELLSWQTALPLTLRLFTIEDLQADASLTLEKKFCVILTLRYHNLRILAHRPILDKYLQLLQSPVLDSHEATMLWQIGGHRNKSACFQSAETIIGIVNLITKFHGNERSLLGAWWFTIYFTFNAALTVVGLILSDELTPMDMEQQVVPGTAERHRYVLDQAISCIPRIDTNNDIVDKCAKFLAALRMAIQGIRNNQPHNINTLSMPPYMNGHHIGATPSPSNGHTPNPPPPQLGIFEPPQMNGPSIGYPDMIFPDMDPEIQNFMLNPAPGFMNTSWPTGDLF